MRKKKKRRRQSLRISIVTMIPVAAVAVAMAAVASLFCGLYANKLESAAPEEKEMQIKWDDLVGLSEWLMVGVVGSGERER